MKKIIVITIILAIFAVCLAFKANKKQVKYLTEQLKPRTIIESVEASGIINPITSVNIGSQVSGMVSALYVDFNSEVKKGQLLAEIDTSLFQAQVDQATANLNNARANYNKIKSIANNNKKTYLRYKNLYKRNYVAKSDLDLAESTYFANLAELDASKAQISQRTAELDTAKANLKYTKIISPVDGVVISRNVDVGQTVASSFSTPTFFLVAKDLTKMQIETNVSEADIGRVKEGQEVIYTLDGYPDLNFKGIVKQVRISPTTVSNVVTYSVIIEVNNDDNKLKPGMSANVAIITAQKKDVLAVSNKALKFTPDTNPNAQKYKEQGLWILKNKKPLRINIKTGVSDSEYTEIISQELQLDDFVIIDFDEKGQKKVKRRMGPI